MRVPTGSMLALCSPTRWVVGLLIACHVLSTLTAVPVPTVVVQFGGAPAGDDLSCVTVCQCTGCSPSTCCCAMTAPAEDTDGVTMLGFSCQPEVNWVIAVVPPMLKPGLSGLDASVRPAAFVPVTDRRSAQSVDLGVPVPPPRRSA